MAEMIPDRLPSSASAGEKKVFAVLQKLPEDVIVYYEPVVGERYPDFVVLLPEVGLLIIEVKGWYPSHISAVDSSNVTISSGGQSEVCKHPIRQARDYMFRLMDIARSHVATEILMQIGGHGSKFVFPFGHAAVLNNCTRTQLENLNISGLFPANKVVTRDELDSISDVEADVILDKLRTFFDPWWQFGRLSGQQIDIIRAVIHPEIKISPVSAIRDEEQPDLKVLDIRQERNARSLGDGHRVIYGVAGSGKTVILIARARLVAENQHRNILILCYNRALAEYFRQVFKGKTNVYCFNFHAWASDRNGVMFVEGEDEEVFGSRLSDRLTQGYGDAHRFDAVFIDEAQDFAQSWFWCARSALKEPDDGDLLIVGDGSQSLYRRRKFTWREAGVNAVGRTINKRFDLDRNYRNTREILTLAAKFLGAQGGGADPEASLQALTPDPSLALRSGPLPQLFLAPSETDEIEAAVRKIDTWVRSGISPEEIAVLYRANTRKWVDRFVQTASRSVPVNWRRRDNAPTFRDAGGICVTTIHSAKGLQWHAVLIMRCDIMPFEPALDENPTDGKRLERGLLYVGMTRAEELLAFSSSSLRGYALEIQEALSG